MSETTTSNSNTDLSGIHIVVTGASSGIGLAMAEGLLRVGATVALASRPGVKLDNQVTRLKSSGLDAYGLPIDVRSETSIAEAVKWVQRIWGKLDVLVNNAGIGMQTVNKRFLVEPQPFFRITPDEFRNMIDTNLTGYFLVARGFTPLMIEQGHGKIINITTDHEDMRCKGFVPYGPSRAGAESLSYIMAEDLRPYGITVNMLLPGGLTDTGMIPVELKRQLKSPLLRPKVMVEPIIFLASSKSDGLTAERITAVEFSKI
ncbi:SDR family NAD(P)-dependent oxidoreductase [Desulfosporosinus youngiae]|uniref:Short-chain alcohol dehydrogenase like protein n=1 Tax=Desulfosporosinus youngiae DSM 17734 TaxID=768710 RepID=H5Y2R8_9FIRM|nr:SDR family oxidoreductase [Desulfosporosinus youngiae]EHQ88331.1 short-chain alcohol dehydrogenase like protein [Desulfosporosinus youngiae DSM 17734]